MTQDHSSKLSFSIEESVWLNKGQEVDEIVSLSLDPEITVQENGEYVLIRGGLKLTGEYRSNGKKAEDIPGPPSLSEKVAFRSIEEVTMNVDGTGEIKHYFPIDVTIPQERIRSLEDIYVIVESFDYDLPERGCIQLTADVAITGMSTGEIERQQLENEQQETSTLTEEVETSYQLEQEEREETPEPAYKEDRSFYYESYSQEETTEEVNSEDDETVVPFPFEDNQIIDTSSEIDRAEETNPQQQEYEVQYGEIEVDETVNLPPSAKEKTPAVAFGVVKDKTTKLQAEPKEELQPEKNNNQSFSMLKGLTKDVKQVKKEVEETPVNETEITDQEAQPLREENALYLTKMLTKGEEEEFKKLKICIIQESETLDVIANRYEVNQSTLIRVNRLNDANVEEGQILYIPIFN